MNEQNQNPTIPPMPDETALHKKHFKSFWPIVIIVVLSALVGGIIVWAAFNQGLDDELNSLLPGSNYKKSRVEKGMEEKKMMEAAPSGETSEWKTYRNEEYGFEITLTDAWKGYKVFTSEGSQGVGSPKYIQFAMPTSDKTVCLVIVSDQVCGYVAPLTITVIAKDRDVSTMDGKIGEDQNNVYYYSLYNHFNPLPSDIEKINLEIPKVVSTFKFTK